MPTDAARRAQRAFTLVEVLAALVLMGIVIPVALEGMGALSHLAVLAEHKSTAMRVAERVLNEQLAVVQQGQAIPTSAVGTDDDGGTSYPWTMQTENWAQDNLTQMTVKVTFRLQEHRYEMKLSTLYDPAAWTPGTTNASGQPTASAKSNP